MTDVILGLGVLFGGLLVVVVVAALLLYWRDTRAKSAGRTAEQIQATSRAVVQLQATLDRTVPGVLIFLMGAFIAVDRLKEHDSQAWIGFVFIVVGVALIRLLARNSWRQYLELKRFSNAIHEDSYTKSPDRPRLDNDRQ